MKLKNEKGVTLVELLVVLALVAMVATLIMSTFFIANRYNLTEMKKLKMQQDANYIVTTVLQKHRTSKSCYELKLNDEENLVYVDCESPDNEVVIGKDFKYELTNIKIDNIPRTEPLTQEDLHVEPKKENVTATLIVEDPKNDKLSVSVDTTFKRYKTEN